MTSGGNNCNYFLQNQLTKCSLCSLNHKGKQVQRNELKSGGRNNLQSKQAENFF